MSFTKDDVSKMIKNTGFSGKVRALIPVTLVTCVAMERLCKGPNTCEMGVKPFRIVLRIQ